MRIIKHARIIKRQELSIKVRLIETSSSGRAKYEMQYYNAPNGKWITPDYGPGSKGWFFSSQKEAIEFWDDMLKLSRKGMAERYEGKGRWVS